MTTTLWEKTQPNLDQGIVAEVRNTQTGERLIIRDTKLGDDFGTLEAIQTYGPYTNDGWNHNIGVEGLLDYQGTQQRSQATRLARKMLELQTVEQFDSLDDRAREQNMVVSYFYNSLTRAQRAALPEQALFMAHPSGHKDTIRLDLLTFTVKFFSILLLLPGAVGLLLSMIALRLINGEWPQHALEKLKVIPGESLSTQALFLAVLALCGLFLFEPLMQLMSHLLNMLKFSAGRYVSYNEPKLDPDLNILYSTPITSRKPESNFHWEHLGIFDSSGVILSHMYMAIMVVIALFIGVSSTTSYLSLQWGAE